jgi:hypothetical protein
MPVVDEMPLNIMKDVTVDKLFELSKMMVP